MDIEGFYEVAERIQRFCEMLQDKRSQDVFWARLRYDMEPTKNNALILEDLADVYLDEIKTCASNQPDKNIILFGAGDYGRFLGKRILQEGEDFSGFCDTKAGTDCETITILEQEKRIFSLDYLLDSAEESYVAITTSDYFMEIKSLLQEKHFPMDHILNCVHMKQYFAFPELFPQGTAFVDAGCCDGADSIRFVRLCEGAYSKILVFEPDYDNLQKCVLNISNESIFNVDYMEAGLGKRSGERYFHKDLNGASHFIERSENASFLARGQRDTGTAEMAHEVALDDHTENITVGFIKMDIEGAEFDALQGAQNTILRDKPLLAICVYRRRGDVLAIMDYLHFLVPEYRFWLRHYGPLQNETVLYAAV